VHVKLTKTISSATAKVGDTVEFEVVDDVLVEGVPVLTRRLDGQRRDFSGGTQKAFWSQRQDCFFHHIRSTGRRREGDGALLPGNFRLV
jgi:hypothetical protein